MLKTGPFLFLFLNLILPAERRGFLKKKNKQKSQQTKTQLLKLKIGPIMLRNILGPVFNFNLDQFLTLDFLFFAETPILLCFQQNAKFKETQKRKKHYLWTHLC